MARFLKSALALVFLSGLVAGCEPKPEEWDEDTFYKYYDVMTNMGTAFAVHDICMPMLDADDEARKRLTQEINPQRWAELLEFDTAEKYAEAVDYLNEIGGEEGQIAYLEEAYQTSYDAAVEQIYTADQCVDTLIDYHNTILNTGVRKY
ncbi:MAG: hypothetical protein EP347_02175 [Alphaproteobacteria bacterium]|nr:MAG: hypothetical protein EP347_02175 [Alphaproteobacteria bacterium]